VRTAEVERQNARDPDFRRVPAKNDRSSIACAEPRRGAELRSANLHRRIYIGESTSANYIGRLGQK